MLKIQNHKELKSFLVLLFFGFLVLLLDRFQVLQPIKAFSEKLFLPPKKAIYQNWQTLTDRARDRVRVKSGEEAKALEDKIEKFKQEIAILNTKYLILSTKYSAAQRLLGTPLPAEWQFIPAQTAGLVDSILTIDKGQVNGIKIGQAVLVEDIFVGKVERVEKYQSWVKLPTAKDSKLLAKAISDEKQGNTRLPSPGGEATGGQAETLKGTESTEIRAQGLLVGYEGKMRLEKVLQEEQLNEGDLVITGEFPPNLVIGKITRVIKNDVEIYQEAEVEPLINYKTLEVVFLLK